MDPKELIAFLGVIEKLKCNTRHAWTSIGTQENVAAHSHRLCVMAFLLRDALPDVDMDRVLKMCLVHDFGEAITGDIPSFLKEKADESAESDAVSRMLDPLPEPIQGEFRELFAEMDALETKEARVFKALDKMEAVLQHNEGPIETWLPLEYALQKTYGVEEAEDFPVLKALRAQMLCDTEEKIRLSGHDTAEEPR